MTRVKKKRLATRRNCSYRFLGMNETIVYSTCKHYQHQNNNKIMIKNSLVVRTLFLGYLASGSPLVSSS
jgi:hypothetical protein